MSKSEIIVHAIGFCIALGAILNLMEGHIRRFKQRQRNKRFR